MIASQAETSLRLVEEVMCPYRRTASGRLRVVWEITNRCNLDCQHCFVDINRPAEELTTAECMAVISELAAMPVSKVMFTGGEPFIKRDFVSILAALRCACPRIVIDITTNLSRVTEAVMTRLVDIGITELSTSLDGDEDAHDQIRRKPGDYTRVLGAIRRARDHGLIVDAVMVVNRLNVHAIERVAAAAFRAGIGSLAFAGLIAQKAAGNKRPGRLALASAERDAAYAEIERLRRRYYPVMPVRTTNFFPERHYGTPCEASELISIDHEGYVYRCLLTSDVPASRPNVKRDRLSSIALRIGPTLHKLEIGREDRTVFSLMPVS